MCYRYTVLHGLKLFATAVRKWAKPLTDFPTSRFQTVGWNSQCRSQLRRPSLNQGRDLSTCHVYLRGGDL